MYLTENLQEKWQPVLEHPDLPKIEDSYKRAVTTVILENQERAVREDASFMAEAAPTNSVSGAGVNNWDPVLISLVRRAMPNLIAYDICGVQPMTGPTGLIFAMKSRFGTFEWALTMRVMLASMYSLDTHLCFLRSSTVFTFSES